MCLVLLGHKHTCVEFSHLVMGNWLIDEAVVIN